MVKRVRNDSSAERIGIRTGDIIYKMGGWPIEGKDQAMRVVNRLRAETTVSLRLVRSGEMYRGLLAFKE